MVALGAVRVGRCADAGAALRNVRRRNDISSCAMCSSGGYVRANSSLASTAADAGHETDNREAGPAPLVRLESVRLAYPSVYVPSGDDVTKPRSSSPVLSASAAAPKKPSRRTRSVLGRSGLSRGESVSRIRIKRLSALGTYDFAAPEISEAYRKKTKDDLEKTKSLTKCIADYGLIADAYSLGTTLKECL